MAQVKLAKTMVNWIIKNPTILSVLVFIILIMSSSAFLRKSNLVLIFTLSALLRIALIFTDKPEKKTNHNLLENMGFQEIDLDFSDEDIFNISDMLEHIFKFAKGFLAWQLRHIYQNYTENLESELTIYILSFAFSKDIAATNPAFRRKFLEVIRKKTEEEISSRMAIPIDDNLKNQIKSAFLFEIWFTDIPRNICYWLVKPYIGGDRVMATHGVRVRPEGKAKGIALVRQNYLPKDGYFDIDIQYDKTILNKNIPVIIGPNFLETGVIDIYSENEAGIFTVNELVKNCREKFYLDILEYNSPFKMMDRWVFDRGGYIEIVGHFKDGIFHPIDKEYSHPLKKTLRNIFQGDPVPMVPEVHKVENLLQEFILEQRSIVKNVLASEGNFEIVYKEIEAGYKKQYQIKHLNWQTKFCIKDDFKSEAYKDPSNYKFFNFNSPGYAPIPFTEGYLMTGPDDSLWLCLFISVSSPAPSEGDGLEKNADDQLTSYLYAYANKRNIKNLTFVAEATQGLVAVGEQGDHVVYIKLLNPDIVNTYHSGEIIRILLDKGILPGIIQVKNIDRRGMEDPEGILVFHTPKLKLLDHIIDTDKLTYENKIEYFLQLALFSQHLINNQIVCTDFTLKDTVEYSDGEKRYVFVCDYGSYIGFKDFKRGKLVCKPEYESPEDLYDDVDLSPEPYQVYKLGIVFFQFMAGSSFRFPNLDFSDEHNFNASLDKSMNFFYETLHPGQQNMVDLIKSMLSSNPKKRPGLNAVIEILGQSVR